MTCPSSPNGYADSACDDIREAGQTVITQAYESADDFSQLLGSLNPDVISVHGALPGMQEAREMGIPSVQLLPAVDAQEVCYCGWNSPLI